MANSIFIKREFVMWVIFAIVLPVSAYGYLFWTKRISRRTVTMFGIALIVIAGANIFLLQHLATMAKSSSSLLDDELFDSALSVTFYLLPAAYAGIGTNLLSHILIRHLNDAEKRFDREKK